MNKIHKEALEYVRNTNGGATQANFIDDHDPIGAVLWNEIYLAGWVETRNGGQIYLTDTAIKAMRD